MLPARYAPQTPFPAYAFVPGMHPHPVTDSRGHSFGRPHAAPAPLDPARPQASREFLEAIDLFNAGYYWEAHEVWEGLWVAANRVGRLADFLKGLIKLAAAGVKAREGRTIGVQRHASRAAQLFESIRGTESSRKTFFCGLNLEELILESHALADHPITDQTPSIGGLAVISYQLTPSDIDHV